MASPEIHPSGAVFNGPLTGNPNQPSAGTVGDAEVSASRPITAAKLEHLHEKQVSQTKTSGASVAERRIVHVVRGATGTVLELAAVLQTAIVGDSTTTINLYKNGSTILTAAIVLTSANTAYTGIATAAGFTSTALVVGDVLEVVITVAANTGTLGQGLCVQLKHREDA